MDVGIDSRWQHELVAEVVAAGKLTATADTKYAIDNTEISFICVGTPTGADAASAIRNEFPCASTTSSRRACFPAC